jgi:hypothetical protein
LMVVNRSVLPICKEIWLDSYKNTQRFIPKKCSNPKFTFRIFSIVFPQRTHRGH